MYWSLLGVLIVIVGFILKLDPLAIVVVAGIVTGLIGGLGIVEILETLGNAFVSQRVITIFILTLPAVGLMERFGLRERASWAIGQIKGAKAGGVFSIYLLIRILVGAFGLRLGGHPQFIRPLILPMAEGATEANYDDVPEEEKERIKWLSAAAENYGNFFGQSIFVGAGGVLLVIGTLAEHGLIEEGYGASRVAMFSIPIGIVAVVVGIGQFVLSEKRLAKKAALKNGSTEKGGNE